MTGGRDKDKDRKKEASTTPKRPDPRLRAFVHMLARRAAEADYAQLLEMQGKTQNPFERKD